MSNSISQAFKSLNISSAATTSDHENIYEVSYQYLKNVRNFEDPHSFQNCLVALINMDKYHKAFQLIGEVDELVHSSFVIEKAYVYYQLGKSDLLNKLYATYTSTNNGGTEITLRALKHILAQNFYKEGENFKALELYHELIKSNQDIDHILDLVCNESATISQTNFITNNNGSNFTGTLTDVSEVSYDLLFNQSLILLSQNKYDLALNKLSEAENLCQSAIADQLELMVELTPIKLTMAYIYQILNDTARSSKLLSELKSHSQISDNNLKFIISNNYYQQENTEEREDNLLVERDLNYEKNLQNLKSKLTKPQYQAIIKNNLLLSFSSSTLSKTSAYFKNQNLKNWVQTFEGDLTPYLFKTLTKLGITFSEIFEQKEGLGKKIYKHVILQQPQFEKQDGSGEEEFISAILLLVFVNHISDRYDQSIKVLESVSEIKIIPSLAGVLIRIYEILNLTTKLHAFVFKITDFILSRISLESSSDFYNFGKIIGFKLLLINESKAKSIFSKLLEINSSDKLIQAVLKTESEQDLHLDSVEDLTSSIRPIENLLKVEIEDLIQDKKSTRTITKESKKKSTKKTSAGGNNSIEKKKKAAKFSSKKVVKPESQFKTDDLDKERWLPLKLRSYYKPSKKDKKKGLGGHQGSIEPASSGASSKNKKKKGKK